MRAMGVVQAALGDHQVVEDLAPQDRPGDDPRDVRDGHVPVPDPLGIDHDGRPVLALVEAAGMIGPGDRPETRLLQLHLEGVLEGLTPFRVAAAPPVAGLADVAADENMMRKCGHIRSRWVPVPRRAGLVRAGGWKKSKIACADHRRQSQSRR